MLLEDKIHSKTDATIVNCACYSHELACFTSVSTCCTCEKITGGMANIEIHFKIFKETCQLADENI